MTAAAPLQRRACAMQIQITDLLQGRAAESLAALLNPPDRDIPKRAEVQPADPRVTLKKKKKEKKCTVFVRRPGAASPLTFESRVFIIHSYMAGVNPCPCVRPDWPVKSTASVCYSSG